MQAYSSEHICRWSFPLSKHNTKPMRLFEGELADEALWCGAKIGRRQTGGGGAGASQTGRFACPFSSGKFLMVSGLFRNVPCKSCQKDRQEEKDKSGKSSQNLGKSPKGQKGTNLDGQVQIGKPHISIPRLPTLEKMNVWSCLTSQRAKGFFELISS